MARKKKTEPTIEDELAGTTNPLDELDVDLGSGFDDMVINLEEIDDSGPAPLPPGKYKGTITGVEVTTSQSGNPMLKIEITVKKPDGSGTQKVWDNYVLNHPVGLSRLKQLVKITAPDAISAFNIRQANEYFLNKTISVQLKTEPGTGQYKDRVFNRVQRIEPWTDLEELI